MIGCGSATFTDPDDYRANVPRTTIDVVLTGGDRFRARVSWINMRRLNVVLIEERAPHVAFVSLAPAAVFVAFPLSSDPLAIWNGVGVRRGEIMLHPGGEHFHQRTPGTFSWGMASLTQEDLAAYSRALLGTALPSLQPEILKPSPGAVADFLRLHTQACRLAQTKPDIASHPEVARALEQDLVGALINCITASERRNHTTTRQRHSEIMTRFEQVLASHGDGPLPMAELCTAVGVPERTLRIYCAAFLGMSPVGYARLRRLNFTRSALLRTDAKAAGVSGVARKYGFSDFGRFAIAYRAVFGETPSTTLRGRSFRETPSPRC